LNIADTRKCNLMNLASVARYLSEPVEAIVNYYDELRADRDFLAGINVRLAEARRKGFTKGIFRKSRVASVDWFAFERVLIYVLIRYFKPLAVLETGVYYGGNTAFALRALDMNRSGRIVSIDFPDSLIRQTKDIVSRHSLVGDSELYDTSLRPGFIVSADIRGRWDLIEGDSLMVIPQLSGKFDFYLHDSDHSMKFLTREMDAAWAKLSDHGLILVDDIDWSNAFFAFCVRHRLHPLLLTDNGKDDLRVRTGIAVRGHRRNEDDAFT
jgi:predicted O-methyltransferase YrrM